MKYPSGIKRNVSVNLNSRQGKRGMSFEKYINESNEYYLYHNIACIHKKPTPIQVTKVEYRTNQNSLQYKHAIIKEAYYKSPSTTDYNGVFRGIYIDFEVKECNSHRYFSLKTIHLHQINHIETVSKMGGIAFVLIYFKKYDLVILIDGLVIAHLYRQQTTISIEQLKTLGTIISIEAFPVINYLKHVLKVYEHYFTD